MPDRLSVLFHRMTEWRGTIRGSTNRLAEAFLADGHDVTWLMPPIHVGHLLLRRQAEATRQWRAGARRAPDGALVVRPFSVVPRPLKRALGGRLYAWQARAAYASLVPPLATVLARHDQPAPDVIWTTGGDGGALRRAFPKARRVVQVVDLYESYQGPSYARLERRDYETADAVVSIGHALAAYLERERGVAGDRLTVIGQGVDRPRYQLDHAEPERLAGAAKPRLIWVGVLSKADPGLMRAALDAVPGGGGSLVLIGPGAPWAEALAARDARVRLVGPVDPEDVPAYLVHADVALMLYRRDVPASRYVGQNPLKLYEYAAAGLPIVSTSHAEYAYTAPPALVADEEASVTEAVRRALSDAGELGERGRRFAEGNTWRARYKEALELLRRLVGASR